MPVNGVNRICQDKERPHPLVVSGCGHKLKASTAEKRAVEIVHVPASDRPATGWVYSIHTYACFM